MSKSFYFSDSERKQIAQAVKDAESTTSGEIVPVIVPESDRYPESYFKSVLFGIVLGFVCFEAYVLLFGGWNTSSGTSLIGLPLFVTLGGGIVFLGAMFLPTIKRLFISSESMDTAVHNRATKAFVEHEVFKTRDRTGIVLLVSLFEKRVEVFGDSGINQAVSADDWSEVISTIIKGVKSGKTTEAMVDGIRQCGTLLERLGVEIRPDDTNELSNLPRFE